VERKNQRELLNCISEATFMLDDITLYLDTHPECQAAIEEYEKYRILRDTSVCEYTERFGPLTRYNVNAENEWNWVDQPWPWEKECGC
jgi:spore coat protein JB